MARDIGKKRLQFMDRRIERSKVQNSRDFKEMTFAITLLAGVSAFLSKVIGYFNNNVITFSGYSTFLIYTLVLMAITILVLLSIFLLLKWYLISIKYENKLIKNITEKTFKFISIYTILWIFILISGFVMSLFIISPFYTEYKFYLIIIYLIIFCMICLQKYKSLKQTTHLQKNTLLSMPLKAKQNEMWSIYSGLLIFSIIMLLFIPIPTYLLMGSYSIEQFPISNTDNDIFTFTIKETGVPFNSNHITLHKMNVNESTIFQNIDNIIISNTHSTPSNNKLITGIKYEGIWYLNVNTSNLSSGTYNIHAEVTNDISTQYVFGTVKKYDDKLFYVAPRSSDFDSNSSNINTSLNI